MPMVGLGTFQIPLEKMNEVIGWAYSSGYRMFDTAWKYKNEGAIASALKHNGIKREDVFISTKCNADALFFGGCHAGKKGLFDVRNFKSVRKIILTSFENLQTDFIDLFLVHWPWPIPEGSRWKGSAFISVSFTRLPSSSPTRRSSRACSLLLMRLKREETFPVP